MKLRDLKKSGHAPSLFASFLYFDVSFMIWVLLGALGVYITKDFGLSPAEKGLIVAIPILGVSPSNASTFDGSKLKKWWHSP